MKVGLITYGGSGQAEAIEVVDCCWSLLTCVLLLVFVVCRIQSGTPVVYQRDPEYGSILLVQRTLLG